MGGLQGGISRAERLPPRLGAQRGGAQRQGGAFGCRAGPWPARGPPHATPTFHSAPTAAPQEANYYGSLTQAGTVSLGLDAEGKEVFVPFSSLLPMVAPDDLVFDGGRSAGPGVGREAGPKLGAGPSLRVPPRLGHIFAEPGGGDAACTGTGLGTAGATLAAHGGHAPAALRLHPGVHRS